jgi:phosphoribosylaminoimidazolecarboxamide formyltransferase/IMP cyclohydrolase
MFKNALISVSDKTGLVEFIKPLAEQGLRIVSTGGTAQHLRAAGLKVFDVSEQTHFPEVMGGRVKTLHPNVHMCLLARQGVEEDQKILAEKGLMPFDLVICNLYPFEATVAKGCSDEEMIENIDIGGPSMLRAAAKNHERVAVVCDPQDYAWILEKSELELSDRRKLAAKVFAHVSSYDSLVAQELGAGWGKELSFAGSRVMDLRYGENPHQHAGWYRNLADSSGLHSSEVLQGKPLSYNNILDLDAAALLVREFQEPTAVAVKHNNPCGIGTAKSIEYAVELAVKADPLSVFGGIIALNKTVSGSAANLLSEIFLECIVAPAFSPEAVAILGKKKNLRLLQWPNMLQAKKRADIRSVTGGFLVQSVDEVRSDERDWKFLGARPSAQELSDLYMAEKVCASLKSNAIAIVKNGQSLGLGMGQVNRVEAVQHAISRVNQHHGTIAGTVLASDAFFPFPDSIEKAAAAGVKWILQPGGSMKDEEVFAVAKKLGVNMIVTGNRHFRH